MKPVARTALVGTAAGVAAAFAMDVVQDGLATLLERDRESDDRDEEIEAVVRLVETFVPGLASERRSHVTARALHYAFGIAFACAYVAATRPFGWLAAGGGVAFGTGLFVLSDRILIPMLKLGRSWDRYSRSERLNAWASHVAYGVVLDYVRRRALKRL